MNLLNESQVFETWAPILEERTGIKDSNKLGWMSKYAHYHSLNEGFTYPQASLFNTPGMGNVAPASTVAGGAATFYGAGSQGSGDKFPSLLPLAIQVAARTVGFDIVPVIPMNGPSGVLTYLDYVYSGGRDPLAPGLNNQTSLGGTANAGNAAKFGDKFQVFKLNTNGFDAAALALWTQANVGDCFVLSQGNIAGQDVSYAFFVTYIGRSRIDGFPLFRVVGEYIGVSDDISAGGTATVNVAIGETQRVPFYQIIDGTTNVNIMTCASYNVNNGAFGVVADTAGDFNYDGTHDGYYVELVRALEDHVQGFAGAGPLNEDAYSGNATNGMTPYEPMRRGIGETAYYKTMGLQAFTKFVEAETFQVAAQVTTEQIQDLNRQYGIDVVSMMENALVNEVSQSINKHILSRAFALGWANHSAFVTVEGTNLNLTLNSAQTAQTNSGYGARFIGKENTLVTVGLPAFQIYGGTTAAFENQGTIQRRIQSKVLAAGNVIAQRGRRGPGNFVVTNLQVATALQDSAQFTFYPMANTVNQNNGALYPLGTLAGMTIYVDPNMEYSDTRILVGRKGADEEPGLKFMPYLMAESIQTIAEGTMSPKIAVKSRYALVEAGFHPETQYFTLLINLKNVGTTENWDAVSNQISIA
jgi:hypothetical protein